MQNQFRSCVHALETMFSTALTHAFTDRQYIDIAASMMNVGK